jgi:hypothetical protein
MIRSVPRLARRLALEELFPGIRLRVATTLMITRVSNEQTPQLQSGVSSGSAKPAAITPTMPNKLTKTSRFQVFISPINGKAHLRLCTSVVSVVPVVGVAERL